MRPIPVHPNQTVTPADPDTRRAAGMCMLAADIFNPALTERLGTRVGGSWCQWALHVQVDVHENPDGTRYALLHTPDRDLRVILRHSEQDTLPFHPEEWHAQLCTPGGAVIATGTHSHSRSVSRFTEGAQ